MVSAPLSPAPETPVSEMNSQEIVPETALSQPEKVEKPAVFITAKTEKPKADDSETKKLEEKLAQTAQLLEALKKASPPPAPTPASASTPAPSSVPALSSGTFRLPNGALADVNGNIIQPAPAVNVSSQTTPPPPTPPTPENYASGSTIQLLRNTLIAIEFNPVVGCESLGLSLKDVKKCQLYRTDKANYNWEIID